MAHKHSNVTARHGGCGKGKKGALLSFLEFAGGGSGSSCLVGCYRRDHVIVIVRLQQLGNLRCCTGQGSGQCRRELQLVVCSCDAYPCVCACCALGCCHWRCCLVWLCCCCRCRRLQSWISCHSPLSSASCCLRCPSEADLASSSPEVPSAHSTWGACQQTAHRHRGLQPRALTTTWLAPV